MKKKYFIKVFSLTICLSIMFSSVVNAKSNRNVNLKTSFMAECVDPHPEEGSGRK